MTPELLTYVTMIASIALLVMFFRERAARQAALELQDKLTELEKQHEQEKQALMPIASLNSTCLAIGYDLIFVVDTDGLVVGASKNAHVLFGSREAKGKLLQDLLESSELQEWVLQSAQDEANLEEQFIIMGRYYRVKSQVLSEMDEKTLIGIAMQDVTELVRLNRARRDMVANISHELNTPIANIRLIIDGLFLERDRPKRKESIASLRDIARETESLQWTVQELLDLSMIESGQAMMRLFDHPLGEIVTDAVERLEEKLDRRELEVEQHVDESLRVLCDQEHLRRVIINLISNAIKWSPKGKTITISASAEDEEVIVSVIDEGPGVPDDQCERIFERFYQVDTARSGGGGSGLGLAISKHIVEAHGGRIWAEGNSQGGGGHFLFTLLNAAAPQHDVIDAVDAISIESTADSELPTV